ncbi:MAG: sugar phosphate isomerase/epimerase family protein [Armatimonadota bacterium]|nr:sugar phosphate isomerase/epimerase [Armatimonadota bacterium]MDW8024330.1 sugar phosphate isomerase/epimerase family protein [Armatimonadota bacterium]
MHGLIYCLNTSTIRPAKLLDKIRVAGECGYGAIELWNDEMDEHLRSGGSMSEIVKALSDYGLIVPTVIAVHNWMTTHGEEYCRALDEAKRRMEQAAEVGAKHIVATPPVRAEGAFDMGMAADRYNELLELGRNIGVLPAVEFLGFSEVIYRVEQAWEIVKMSGARDGSVVLDTFHLYRGGSSLDDVPDLTGEFIAVFHFNDVPATVPRESLTDADRVYPGDGILPLHQIVRDVIGRGYRGAISLELFNRELWERDPKEVAQVGIEKMRAIVEGQ